MVLFFWQPPLTSIFGSLWKIQGKIWHNGLWGGSLWDIGLLPVLEDDKTYKIHQLGWWKRYNEWDPHYIKRCRIISMPVIVMFIHLLETTNYYNCRQTHFCVNYTLFQQFYPTLTNICFEVPPNCTSMNYSMSPMQAPYSRNWRCNKGFPYSESTSWHDARLTGYQKKCYTDTVICSSFQKPWCFISISQISGVYQLASLGGICSTDRRIFGHLSSKQASQSKCGASSSTGAPTCTLNMTSPLSKWSFSIDTLPWPRWWEKTCLGSAYESGQNSLGVSLWWLLQVHCLTCKKMTDNV